jgi:penicillin-binding protein 1C
VRSSKHLTSQAHKKYKPIIKLDFKLIGYLLSSIGKPFYYLFVALVVFIFLILNIFRIISEVFLQPFNKFRKLRALQIGIGAIFLFCFCSTWVIRQIVRDLPDPEKLIERKMEASTRILDRNNKLLYKIYKDKNRSPIKLSSLPLHTRLAILAAEDAEFYNHRGFSLRGIARATKKYLKEGKITGGSTITQQLVKNVLLSSEKTLLRKIKEIVLAIEVERYLSKDQILEMYINEVGYGGTAYGIQEAAKAYFGKDASDLSLAESALIAGLPKNPTKYSPFGINPELGLERQKEVLNLMVENGFINEEEEKKTLAEEMHFVANKTDIEAPHFVMYVRQILEEKFGKEYVEKGGLEVVTSLDMSLQEKMEKIVKDEVERIENYGVSNGAAIIVNPKTGEILAMVGSKDYFDRANDGNVNVLTRLRQPGSSIKIINYAYALSHGFTPASIISDSPVKFEIKGQAPYSPKNYDSKFRGNLTLRNALAESRNIPAVKVLASYGVDKMIELGKKMGITSWEEKDKFGLSLTLGGGDVYLLDLAQVYATVANYGTKVSFKPIREVRTLDGEIVYSSECVEGKFGFLSERENCKEKVLDPRVAFQLISILSDNLARAPAFGLNSALVIPQHPEVAVKTGTSNNLRDNLTIGFNQDYLVATWVGNNDSRPMRRIASGVTGAAPIWNKIMTNLVKDAPSLTWETPERIVSMAVCTQKGMKNEWFLEENKPAKPCRQENIVAQPQVLVIN